MKEDKEYEDMNKQELIEIIKNLSNEIMHLEDIQDDLEIEIEELKYNDNEYYGIKDIDNFIWKLKLDNLYDENIERFIDLYMKHYNED